MSNPGAYIEEHMAEYHQLIYYGAHTLRYCYASFEHGGQTGLDGHIMAAACREILGEEDIDILAETGQDWYEAFKQHVEALREQEGDAYLAENLPGSYLLLKTIGSVTG
jgi:hypothetical protein